MKKSCILLSVFLLMLPQIMCGQGPRYAGLKALYEVFDKISSTESVSISSNKKESSAINDKSEVLDSLCEEISYIRVLKNDFSLLDELKTAFLIEDDHKTSVYTCFGPLDEAYRQPFAVRLNRGKDFYVGKKTDSSYAIATYEDPNLQGYRMVIAAEWWKTDKDTIEGVLLKSYGKKPQQHHYTAKAIWGDKKPSNLNDSNLNALMRQWPSLASADSMMKVYFPDCKVDFATNPSDWMRQAMGNTANMNASEWMRLFGMMTQKMIDRAEKESSENLVVSAGILLDMSKNANSLDKDEKEICAARLREVAELLQSRNKYVHDILMLAAKKLQKK